MWCAGAAIGIFLLLSACSTVGDFGRPKRSTVLASLDEPVWLGSGPGWVNGDGFDETREAVSEGGPGAVLPLTAEEIQLREAAYRLRVQVYNQMPIGASSDTEVAYAEHLTRQGYLHGPSRLAKIETEINADHDALTKFAQAARVVLSADYVRLEAARDRGSSLSGEDKHGARSRIGENYLVIRRTLADIERRVAAYAYALDRTRIETPVLAIGPAKAALAHLHDRTASLRYELAQAHETTYRLAGHAASPLRSNDPIDIRPRRHRSDSRRRDVIK